MEKTKTNKKRKLVIALCSMVLCLVLMGVTVYAALSQTMTLTSSIAITQDGQCQVAVSVKEASSTATTAFVLGTGTMTVGNEVATKLAADNEETTAVDAIVFSQANGKNAYGFEITLTNANAAANYTISVTEAGNATPYDPPAGIELAIGTTQAGSTVGTTTNGTLTANGETATATVYVIFYSTSALGDLAEAAAKNFQINIALSVNP